MSEGKIGIYLTAMEREDIYSALCMYSSRLRKDNKDRKDPDILEWEKEVKNLRKIIHQPWKSDRLVSPKPTS